ncbi:DUF1501 domain-containing protein [Shewanella sp. JBTF-M18]|uniref:DUF1501 domain-containing protein n=1 Tax=Shewanella insulae TaxID=2681496 RepID=A0A6L7HZ26_9GAMM|nr:DUF1501 domain-containing protein [Shewanella insulae]MXR69589.1 DUF1501 domain-containing protein [Shewanella insulae]
MNRREFIKGLAALTSMAACSRFALANTGNANGQFWVFVSADGGWDTTSVCDPKGNIEYSSSKGVINNYNTSAIRQVGNFQIAPMLNSSYSGPDHLGNFFNAQYQNLRVFNGVDCGTNSHTAGMHAFATGHQSPAYPTTPALIASLNQSQYLMPYYLGSGYGKTAGIVQAARLNDLSRVSSMADTDRYLPQDILEMVNSEQQAALSDYSNSALNDAELVALSQFGNAHTHGGDLSRLLNSMPANPSSGQLLRAEIAAAAFAAGLSTTASIGLGAFDTHSNNDEGQGKEIPAYFELINHLIAQLQYQGIADRTTIVMGSDFGRTPYYNGDQGKDHWSIGSMMVWDKLMTGNLLVGATDSQLRAQAVDPDSLALSPDGIILSPGHLHAAIRAKMGIGQASELSFKFPLGVETLGLLD